MARYLIRPFIESSLHRGTSVMQFLGGFTAGDEPALRYLELRPGEEEGVEVWLHEVFDAGSESFADLGAFGAVDEDAGDEPAAMVRTVDEALALAQERFGAAPDRWVNESMIGDEYLDYLRRKQAPAPPAGRGGLTSFIRALRDRFR